MIAESLASKQYGRHIKQNEQTYRNVANLHLNTTLELGFVSESFEKKINAAVEKWEKESAKRIDIRRLFFFMDDTYEIMLYISTLCLANNMLKNQDFFSPIDEKAFDGLGFVFNSFLSAVTHQFAIDDEENFLFPLFMGYAKGLLAFDFIGREKETFLTSLEELYPIFSNIKNVVSPKNSTYSDKFSFPLTRSKAVEFVRNNRGLDLSANSSGDKAIKEFIRSGEIFYKFQLELIAYNFLSLSFDSGRSDDEKKTEKKFIDDFNNIYNSYVNKDLVFRKGVQGVRTSRHLELEEILVDVYAKSYSSLERLTMLRHRRADSEYLLNIDQFSTQDAIEVMRQPLFAILERMNKQLKIIQDAYFQFLEKDVDEGQRDIEKEISDKIGLIFGAVNSHNLHLARRLEARFFLDLGDIIHFWKINQENKKDVKDELESRKNLNNEELLSEVEAKNITDEEQAEFEKFKRDREEVYESEYADLIAKMEEQAESLRSEIAEAKKARILAIERKNEALEATERIKLEREFQAEINTLLKDT